MEALNYREFIRPNGGHEIIRDGHASGRKFASPNDRCDCQDQISM
jgi:hypothetical protein